MSKLIKYLLKQLEVICESVVCFVVADNKKLRPQRLDSLLLINYL
jgi:hypothetical protein